MICTNLSTKKAGDPQTLYALLHCSVFKERIGSRDAFEANPPTSSGLSSVRADGYHIAAYRGCQGTLGKRLARPAGAGAAAALATVTPMLLDHVDLRVSDFSKVRSLYDTLLPAMGFSRIDEDDETVCYYRPGDDRSAPFFAIAADPAHRSNGTRIALRASSRAEVDRLAAVAREAGARAFEPAQLVLEYTPFYYATFFEDADGNKLEICCREKPPL